MLFSAFAHVAIFAGFVVVHAQRARLDVGSPEPVAPMGLIDVGVASAEPTHEASAAGPGAVATAAPAPASHPRATRGHAASHGVTNAPMHAVGTSMPRTGDWVGTYECMGGVYGLAIQIERVKGNEFRVLGSATSPTGIHGMYAQHGMRDPSTGEARFLPDGWVGTPMPNHHIAGMHGRFDGDSFSGAIDESGCGAVSLRRQTS